MVSLARNFVIQLFLLAIVWPLSLSANDTPDSEFRVLVLGDSLAAGYGLPVNDTFPVMLENALKGRGYSVSVINAGVSGDTTAGGLARLDWALSDLPELVIVELGANDALRGLDIAQTRANLDQIIARLKKAGVQILLAGMQAPRNMGRNYVERFDAIYPELASEHQVALYPFFLDGVALEPELNQSDGIHPNAKGVAVIVERIIPFLVPLLPHQ